MMMRKFAATSALVIAALGVAAGTAHAEPTKTSPLPGVNLTVNYDDKVATIASDAGTMAVEDGIFKIKADNGTVLAGTPLEFRVDDFAFPITADISGNKATLTPQLSMDKALYKPVANVPFADNGTFKNEYEREKAAFAVMKDHIGLAVTLASITGAIIGGVVGCALGALTGTVLTGPLATLFGAGPLAGCLIGGVALAGVTGIGATILIAAPVAIAEVIQYFSVINTPFVPPAK